MQISVNNLTFFPEYIHGISIKFEISVSFQKFQNSNPDLFCYDFQQKHWDWARWAVGARSLNEHKISTHVHSQIYLLHFEFSGATDLDHRIHYASPDEPW